MRRPNHVSKPTPEMTQKLYQARMAATTQKSRPLKCPYCGRCTLIIFEDTRGHIQTKCKSCGQEIVFDVSGSAKIVS